MKRYIFIVLFAIMAFLNVVLVFKNLSINKKLSSSKSLSSDSYLNKFLVEKENENIKMPMGLKLIDMKGDTVCAKDVFKKNTLIFRYSVLNCSDCVNFELEILIKEIASNQKYQNVCLLTYYDNARELVIDYRKFQEKKLNVSMFVLAENKFNIPIEKQNIPYYFIVNENLTMSNFYIPIKEMKDWTIKYLRLTLKNF